MTEDGHPGAQTNFEARQASVLDLTRRRVEEVRKAALEVHARTLQERNARVAEVNASLKRTVERVNAQHKAVAASLRQDAVTREVHVTVSRSLESLERFVRVMKHSTVSEEKMMEAVQDPVVTGTIFDRERRASVSNLIQSVQQQLILQSEFLSVAAHELRTPILPILANAELLYDRIQGDTRELDAIVRNGLRLQRLAENILSATKIESGTAHYRKEPFDINQVLAQTIQDLKNTIRSKNLRIVFVHETERLVVVGDQDRIGQVIGNILDNAVKFTPEGAVRVSSRTTEGAVEVSVADEGPGIDPQVFPVLFSKFAAKSAKGTGLGLYISKKIIEAHGGSIWAANGALGAGHGSVFTFVLPTPEVSREE